MNLQPTENAVTQIALCITKIALFLQQAIVGYGFHPTEEELINYLKWKVTGCRETFCIIPTLENIYEINPWDLPAKFNEKSIIPCKNKTGGSYVHRHRTNGLAGKHHAVLLGRSPGAKSSWVMHELHPHPDNTGFVLCWLKMKQDENAENQERSFLEVVIAELSKIISSKSDGSYQNGTKFPAPIHEDNHHLSPNQEHLMSTKDSSSTANSSGSFLAVSEPRNHELNFPHPFPDVDVCTAIEAEEEYTNQRKANLVQPLEKEDEMSRTSNFIGELADDYCDIMDCENPEQLPFAEHQVREMENRLKELIMNGSSSSTEISSGSCTTVTKESSRMEPWMLSPRSCDLFPNDKLFDIYGLISEPEREIGVSQYGQPKLGHSPSTEKIIPESASSDGVPAKAKVSKRIQLKLILKNYTKSTAEVGEAPKVGLCYDCQLRSLCYLDRLSMEVKLLSTIIFILPEFMKSRTKRKPLN
ncbi:hypothetical protein NL676_039083 [Syzygium grande]|nr:hypothetical protein NL676_039083 [Syzygium grande]